MGVRKLATSGMLALVLVLTPALALSQAQYVGANGTASGQESGAAGGGVFD